MAERFERIYEKRLGQILIEEGIITFQDLEKALRVQTERGGLLGEILIEMGTITPKDMERVLFLQFGVGFRFILLPPHGTVDLGVIALVPREVAEKHCLIPFSRHQNVLTVVISDPLTKDEIFEELEKVTGLEIQFFIGLTSQIKTAIKYYYGLREK